MNKVTKRKIGAGILDFYLVFIIISFLVISILSLGGISFNYSIAIAVLIISISITVLYQMKSSSTNFISIGELAFGISKDEPTIKLEKYNLKRILNIIGTFLILIPVSKILEYQIEQDIKPSSLTILGFLIILTLYSLYNYYKFGGIKNEILIVGIAIIINWSNNGTFNFGVNWSTLPLLYWTIMIARNKLAKEKN